MNCRPGCAACCIAPSISTPLPGHPDGKPAGVTCANLDEQLRCRLFGKPERPAVCISLRPAREMCGESRREALIWLAELEALTNPSVSLSPAQRSPRVRRGSQRGSIVTSTRSFKTRW